MFLASLDAFLLRETRQQFGHLRMGYFWGFIEPAATVTVLTVLHGVVMGGNLPIYGASPIIFFVFGAVPFFTFFGAVNRAQTAFAGNKGMFNYRQVKPIDVVLARSIIESLSMVGVGGVFLIAWVWLGHPIDIRDPLLLIVMLFLLFALGLGLGILFGVYGMVYSDLQRIFGITMRPMFFISGLFFTIDMIPPEYRPWVDWNPVLHAVDLVRQAVIPGYQSPADFSFVVICVVVLWFIALAAYRRYLPRLL